MRGARVAFPLTRSLEAKPTDKTTVENIALTSKSSVAVTKLGGELTDADLEAGKTDAHVLAAAAATGATRPPPRADSLSPAPLSSPPITPCATSVTGTYSST